MKTKSCFSIKTDPYRAGVEIGEQLADINPEVIFLFSSIHYQGSPELLEAIYDELGSDDVVLIGNTGDGFFERDKVAHIGVTALGINSDKAITWHLACEAGAQKDPAGATKRCLENLRKACFADPALYFIASDFRTDASKIVSSIQETTSVPVVGGFAGDDFQKKECFVFANKRVITDHIAMLAIEGPLAFDIRFANQQHALRESGIVTECDDKLVQTIDNIPAMKFVEKQLGKPFVDVDKGMVCLNLTSKSGKRTIRCIRVPDIDLTGSAELFGSIEEGSTVRICLTPPEMIISDVRNIAGDLSKLPFEPEAALIISCAGRKSVLKDGLKYEPQEILKGCPALKALVGYPSFGEFGPLKNADGYEQTIFHNMTSIVLTMGMK
ncbi:MAG: FIST N-terminal domain-containing protein [Pseudomonadota bacterium]|nr:FIST N-terminal domain-containing protein [Pseudomonadota bacterium]